MAFKQLLLGLVLVTSLAVGEGKTLKNPNSNQVQLKEIPAEFQFQCKSIEGPNSVTCDRRDEACINYVGPQCQACKVDICAFADGKDFEATRKQCQQQCPLFWDTIKAEVDCREFERRCAATTSTVTMTGAEPCAGLRAEKEKLSQELKHKDDTISTLTVTIVLLVLVVLIQLGVALYLHRTQLAKMWERLNQRVKCEKVGPEDEAAHTYQGPVQDGDKNEENEALVPQNADDADAGRDRSQVNLSNQHTSSNAKLYQTAKLVDQSRTGD